jgi:catechol 2,3-dioxygenase-like lactoylglutathione lyase family enzyme
MTTSLVEHPAAKHLLAHAFNLWTAVLRGRRVLRAIGRPRLGVLDHVTIPVDDLDVARAFYCDVLGAAYLMKVDDETFRRFGRPPAPDGGVGAHHISVFMTGATRIDLFLQPCGHGRADLGHPHYAFNVPARRLLDWKRRFETRGIPHDGPLQLGPPGQASIYFNDPFGNHLEVVTLGFTGHVEHRPPAMERLTWPGTRLANEAAAAGA